ncbi:MAG: hypothetical protein ACXVW6_05270 [Nocardioidaceae bacterium]
MNVRRNIAVVAMVVAAPVISACGVNFGAQTDQVYNAAVGVDNRSGQVNVLNALIVSGVDGSGTVVAGLVNKNQNRPDALTGITAGAPGENLTVSGPTTTVPAGGTVSLATKGAYSAHGAPITGGSFVKLTFTFKNSQAVTVDVPVVLATNPDYKNVPLPKS